MVQGATRLPISCATAAEALVKKAAAARAVESTAMNAVSSRSHSVFTLYITGRHETSGQSLQGALNLVDLAGRWVCCCPSMACVEHGHAYCCCTLLLLHIAPERYTVLLQHAPLIVIHTTAVLSCTCIVIDHTTACTAL